MHNLKACKNLNSFTQWDELSLMKYKNNYQQKLKSQHINLTIDHHQLDHQTLKKLAEISTLQGFQEARAKWLKGEVSLDMPSYILLRSFSSKALDDSHVFEFSKVLSMRDEIKQISDKISKNEWLGYSHKPIKDIVNIGIGGSDLGTKFCYEALNAFRINHEINCHFVSDADFYSLNDCLKKLNPETTLFLVSSKSFTTSETLHNAKIAKEWLQQPDGWASNFIAITANPEKAKDFGFKHILSFGKWVVGRYSCSSAINLINSILVGYENYLEFLRGAEEMDQHFLMTDWEENIPMLLAFVGIWNINFLNIPTQLFLIYHSRLRLFCDYVQQLDMESNGKSYNRNGEFLPYSTGPIVWGGLGNQAQHSYYQLLAQGSHQIAIDFLSVLDKNNEYLNAFCFKRQNNIFQGFELNNDISCTIKQQNSVNHIQLTALSPRSIGALIALYEHKVFTMAWMWNINPFDQPGVESAKMHGTEIREN